MFSFVPIDHLKILLPTLNLQCWRWCTIQYHNINPLLEKKSIVSGLYFYKLFRARLLGQAVAVVEVEDKCFSNFKFPSTGHWDSSPWCPG